MAKIYTYKSPDQPRSSSGFSLLRLFHAIGDFISEVSGSFRPGKKKLPLKRSRFEWQGGEGGGKKEKKVDEQQKSFEESAELEESVNRDSLETSNARERRSLSRETPEPSKEIRSFSTDDQEASFERGSFQEWEGEDTPGYDQTGFEEPRLKESGSGFKQDFPQVGGRKGTSGFTRDALGLPQGGDSTQGQRVDWGGKPGGVRGVNFFRQLLGFLRNSFSGVQRALSFSNIGGFFSHTVSGLARQIITQGLGGLIRGTAGHLGGLVARGAAPLAAKLGLMLGSAIAAAGSAAAGALASAIGTVGCIIGCVFILLVGFVLFVVVIVMSAMNDYEKTSNGMPPGSSSYISLSKSVTVDSVVTNEVEGRKKLSYTISVKPKGDSKLTNVEILDTFDRKGVNFVDENTLTVGVFIPDETTFFEASQRPMITNRDLFNKYTCGAGITITTICLKVDTLESEIRFKVEVSTLDSVTKKDPIYNTVTATASYDEKDSDKKAKASAVAVLNSPDVVITPDGRYAFPVKGSYSWTCSHPWENQNSIDIFAVGGTPVAAVTDGEIRLEGDATSKSGFALWVYGKDGRFYFYAHLKEEGRVSGSVSAGQIIGYIAPDGESANNGAAHVHFSVGSEPRYPPNIPAGPLLDMIAGTNKCGG